MSYPTDGKIGARINASSTAEFKLGERVQASDGQVWLYVQAGEAIDASDFLAIDENFQALAVTTTNVVDAVFLGVATVALANDEYCFVVINGTNINGNIDGASDIDPGKPLAVSGTTAGHLAIYTTTTQTKLAGIMTVATVSTTTASEVLLNSPHAILNV